jgi:serine/threonine-protein kinase ULK/ATG1
MIVEGLVYTSEKGIIHRDIKPANILMRDSIAKICDFGFCGFLQGTDPKSTYIMENFSVGSPLYMSPEAYRNNQYSIKSDIWAVGITLYEMLIG